MTMPTTAMPIRSVRDCNESTNGEDVRGRVRCVHWAGLDMPSTDHARLFVGGREVTARNALGIKGTKVQVQAIAYMMPM